MIFGWLFVTTRWEEDRQAVLLASLSSPMPRTGGTAPLVAVGSDVSPVGDRPPQATAVPAPADTRYRDGNYSASTATPWGTLSVKVTASGGRWTVVAPTQIPPSPPAQQAIPVLAQRALVSQSAVIDGVSGATYASDAFRDDLAEIVRQSLRP